MPDVNEQIAKEYFELHHFMVATNVPFDIRTNEVDQKSDFDLVVRNLEVIKEDNDVPFVLGHSSIRTIEAAVVEVKGWHTSRLTPGYVRKGTVPRSGIIKFVSPKAIRQAKQATGVVEPKAILVVSKLAKSIEDRAKTQEILISAGVDHVLLFDEILRSLIESVDIKRHYAHSETLHVLRLLKNYKMLKDDI